MAEQGTFVTLHTSLRNIRVFPSGGVASMIHRDVLGNSYLRRGNHLNLERLNMLQVIPELGLVFVGCQAGEVVVLSLTYHVEMRQPTFRVDARVPHQASQRNALRGPLLGLAVGPMQGHEDPSEHPVDVLRTVRSGRRSRAETRGFRLFLAFYDGTVLCYGVGRKTEDDMARELVVP
jgi:hypothetical protein